MAKRAVYTVARSAFWVSARSVWRSPNAPHAFGLKLCTVTRANWEAATLAGIKRFGITEFATLDDFIGQCDIITLHLPLTAETENLVDEKFLARMKDNAILINTARGELVDEAALIRAMETRGIRAGLDVFQNEPARSEALFESALANHPKVRGTHHIGASTEQAQLAVAEWSCCARSTRSVTANCCTASTTVTPNIGNL